MLPPHARGDGVGADEFMVILRHITEASNAVARQRKAGQPKDNVFAAGRLRRLLCRFQCIALAIMELVASTATYLALGALRAALRLVMFNRALPCLRCCTSRAAKAGDVDRLTSAHWAVANLVVQIQGQHREWRSRSAHVRAFLRRHRISSVLCMRVRKHLDRCLPSKVRGNADQLRTLAAELMMDLLEEMRVPPFAAHPFFVNLRSKHPQLVRELCREALQPMLKLPDEVIFSAGEVCSKMYVVISGHVQYSAIVPQRDAPAGAMPTIVKRALHGGQWLSEAALWTSWVHRGELRSVGEVLLFALDASGFARVISSHKSAHTYAAAYARKFVEGLNRGLQTDLVEALYLSEAGGNDQ